MLQHYIGLKAIVFAPKEGYMTLGVWSGFREEISASDSLLLIIDGSDYLFIHLSSPLLSFPTSAWSGSPSLKRGQPGGNVKKTRHSFILDVGIKNYGVI